MNEYMICIENLARRFVGCAQEALATDDGARCTRGGFCMYLSVFVSLFAR